VSLRYRLAADLHVGVWNMGMENQRAVLGKRRRFGYTDVEIPKSLGLKRKRLLDKGSGKGIRRNRRDERDGM
jgi:hypothetical protein